jgi:TadE-like protein
MYWTPRPRNGQTMVELALVLPLFIMVVVGIIVLGIGVFYNQQLTNAAREAAIHSATAVCPTEGTFQPASPPESYPFTGCDTKALGWPFMTPHARAATFGLNRSQVFISACWSGYKLNSSGARDAPPPGTYDVIGTIESTFDQCLIGGVDPTVTTAGIGCSNGLSTTDKASSISESKERIVANTVTAYACYVWTPPMAGFLVIPPTVTLRAVATEAIERQQ